MIGWSVNLLEYKTLLLTNVITKKQLASIQDVLNEQAKEGWELHSLTPQATLGGTDSNLAVFKR